MKELDARAKRGRTLLARAGSRRSNRSTASLRSIPHLWSSPATRGRMKEGLNDLNALNGLNPERSDAKRS